MIRAQIAARGAQAGGRLGEQRGARRVYAPDAGWTLHKRGVIVGSVRGEAEAS
jgi:hypothetical protein